MKRPARVTLAVLVGALPLLLICAADLPFVPAAEARLEHEARGRAKAASVEAQLGTFPVIGRALLLGEVESVDLTWFGARMGAIEAVALQLRLDGVGFDRSDLFGGEPRINGVESGEIRVLISPSQLTRLFAREVIIEAGRVQVQLTPATRVDVRVSATDRGLVLAAEGVEPVTAELGASNIPCAPRADVERGNLLLHCSFRGLPPILRDGVIPAG